MNGKHVMHVGDMELETPSAMVRVRFTKKGETKAGRFYMPGSLLMLRDDEAQALIKSNKAVAAPFGGDDGANTITSAE